MSICGCRKNGVAFLEGCSPENIVVRLDGACT